MESVENLKNPTYWFKNNFINSRKKKIVESPGWKTAVGK